MEFGNVLDLKEDFDFVEIGRNMANDGTCPFHSAGSKLTAVVTIEKGGIVRKLRVISKCRRSGSISAIVSSAIEGDIDARRGVVIYVFLIRASYPS